MKNKLIALAFSDFHLHLWEPRHRTRQQFLFYTFIQRVAKRKKVPILFPGDFFHQWRSLDTELFCMLHQLPDLAPFYGISGNHDFKHKNTLENPSPSLYNGLCNLSTHMTCLDDGKIFIINGDIKIMGIPYLDGNVGFTEKVKELSKKEGKKILMIHTDLPGAKDVGGREVGSVVNMDEDIYTLLGKFDLVLAGHIHKQNKLSDNVYMLGAPQAQRVQDIPETFYYWEIYDDFSVKKKPVPDALRISWEQESKKKTKEIEVTEVKSIKSSKSRRGIIRKYCKENEITSKEKKKALKDILLK